MKNVILAVMAMLTLAGPASAASDWDIFWGTTVHNALDPKTNGWDELFGVTLNPENSGWNDFWYQCQDPDKTQWDCVGTVAAGVGFAVALPIAAVGVVATAAGLTAGGIGAGVVAAPATVTYILTSGGLSIVAPAATTGLTPIAFTASGGVIFAL